MVTVILKWGPAVLGPIPGYCRDAASRIDVSAGIDVKIASHTQAVSVGQSGASVDVTEATDASRR